MTYDRSPDFLQASVKSLESICIEIEDRPDGSAELSMTGHDEGTEWSAYRLGGSSKIDPEIVHIASQVRDFSLARSITGGIYGPIAREIAREAGLEVEGGDHDEVIRVIRPSFDRFEQTARSLNPALSLVQLSGVQLYDYERLRQAHEDVETLIGEENHGLHDMVVHGVFDILQPPELRQLFGIDIPSDVRSRASILDNYSFWFGVGIAQATSETEFKEEYRINPVSIILQFLVQECYQDLDVIGYTPNEITTVIEKHLMDIHGRF